MEDVGEEIQRLMKELGLDYLGLLRVARAVLCAEAQYAEAMFHHATSDMQDLHPEEGPLHEMRASVFGTACVALGQVIAGREGSDDSGTE